MIKTEKIMIEEKTVSNLLHVIDSLIDAKVKLIFESGISERYKQFNKLIEYRWKHICIIN